MGRVDVLGEALAGSQAEENGGYYFIGGQELAGFCCQITMEQVDLASVLGLPGDRNDRPSLCLWQACSPPGKITS